MNFFQIAPVDLCIDITNFLEFLNAQKIGILKLTEKELPNGLTFQFSKTLSRKYGKIIKENSTQLVKRISRAS